MPKADRLETDKRIEAARILILRGDDGARICQNLSAAFNVTDRQARRYIAAARAQIQEIEQVMRVVMHAEHVSARRHVRSEALRAGDYRAALAALDSEAKLLDLFPAAKSEVSGPGGGRLTIEIVRHDDDSDEGDEGESADANDTTAPAAIAPAAEANQATGGEV